MNADDAVAPPIDELLARARRGDLAYQSFAEGVEICRLWGDPESLSVAVLRYTPGARVRRHRHEGEEHVYVLTGSQVDDNGVHRAGEHYVNPPGSEHTVGSPEGCVVLVVWHRPNTFLER